jgi:glycosyltransferase involved in cell wall biosynthesis
MASRLAYLVTEDWYFLQHRLPMARAARGAGYEVHVLTRVSERGAEIEREGFTLHPLSWKRRAAGPIASASAVAEVRSKLRQIRPDILHNVALKPAIIGSLACIGLPSGPEIVSSVNGLGSGFLADSVLGRMKARALKVVLGALLSRPRTHVIVQNPDDGRAISGIGVHSDKIRLIPGSGVDVDRLRSLPEPAPVPIRYAYVGRMLEDKGVRTLIAAHRLLRARGNMLELVLAGLPDPENTSTIPH